MLAKCLTQLAFFSALAGLGATGCTSGEHDQSFTFLVAPATDGSFTGWTDIKLGVDISSIGPTQLWGVSLGMRPPAPVPDLTFLATLVGKAETSTAETQVVHLDSFPKGQTTVDLDIDYTGDLHPLFMTDNEIRIDWSGTTNPDFEAWPAGGIWMQGDIVINVD